MGLKGWGYMETDLHEGFLGEWYLKGYVRLEEVTVVQHVEGTFLYCLMREGGVVENNDNYSLR